MEKDLDEDNNLFGKSNYFQEEDPVLLAVDCIIFGFDKKNLKILLVKRSFEPDMGKWSLIGGFLKKNENLDQTTSRVLENLTGLNDIYLEQLYTYSRIDRDPAQRIISVAYYALIDVNDSRYNGIKVDSAQWFDIDKAPNLILDHNEMVEKAKSSLKKYALNRPIGFELLPEKFTMRQLQDLYESILGKKLDKRNFINKINSFDILVKLDEKDMSVSRKGAYLYIFDKDKYNKKVEEDGFIFKL
ncbi:NUDIX hydrolase [Flagellimonas okinawensis]|uniref:NUDIX domain-containing protein n=1 Tax=Flagellimonas okinawensis TaxID=3031324 RepID=A0ABT5XLB3_9FLAO|nr:NUDIX domain-containing protein [[Muricauda] okinawensis]MDF0706687.1 NUDIX domain-containing protein [[Muricauda] okinawensis]